MQTVVLQERLINTKPFLRWAGGKTWLLRHLNQILPEHFNNYHEPFLGGGSVFFHIKSHHKSYLSDLNKDLINTYIELRDNVDLVIQKLQTFKNDKDHYYSIRNQQYTDRIDQVAKFLYLNKTSFNGIYRVNREGIFNVPYGYRNNVDIVNEEGLKQASIFLQNATLSCSDFQESLKNIKANDLVFLDPPYTVAHENNGFVEYNQKIFSWEDQERLANYIKQIKQKNAYFILTNAAHTSIDELFGSLGSKIILERPSLIGGKGAKRKQIHEFIYTNIK